MQPKKEIGAGDSDSFTKTAEKSFPFMKESQPRLGSL